MFNWWNAATERQPRCRYGYIHVVNNLYTASASVGASKLGVTNGFSCNVLTENNHFISQNDPIDLGKQAGTGSVQQAVGNLFESCTGNQKGSGTAFTPALRLQIVHGARRRGEGAGAEARRRHPDQPDRLPVAARR